jgi:polyisoprenoid-binding protein YceI
MRNTLCLGLAALISAPVLAAPETYTIDSAHTYPSFAVSHWGFSTMRGRFDQSAGKIVMDRAAKTIQVDITVEAKSITTGDAKRDEHLRSPDFFNAAEHPRITFRSTGAKWNGENLAAVDGNLTILGVTRPVTLAMTAFRCGEDPRKRQRCGGDAQTSFKRSDFGMKFGIPAVGDDIAMTSRSRR